jgi:unsaturated rhamnogalacturonyl hydrolase
MPKYGINIFIKGFSVKEKGKIMCSKLARFGLLLIVLNLCQPAFSEVQILGSWVTGTSHTKEPGSNRLLIVIGHAEGSANSDNYPYLSAVNYGNQPMTKIADKTQTWENETRAYVAVFILNEAGVAAASNSNIVGSWSGTTSNSFTSVFLGNVDQTNPIGDFAVNGVTNAATIATSALATSNGDMVIAGVTCTEGGTATYSPNNGFLEGIESPITNADGCGDYKAATGVPETPSVTHSTGTNRQAIIGLVVQAILDANKASHPSPGNGISGVSSAADLSWDAPAEYTPISYDVYFGTNSAVRSNPKHTVFSNSYEPPEYLAEETTYYWAVDSNDAGTIYPGDDWSFTTYVPVDGDLVANFILSKPLTEHYASASSYYGVLLYSELTGHTEMTDSVIAAFPTVYYNGSQMPPIGSVDAGAYGILPFELYRQTGDANYLTSAVYLADEEFTPPRSDGLCKYTRFWIDDTYMVGSLQAQAYKSMGDIIYANRATAQLLGYMGVVQNLQQPNGLFYHTTSAPIHWGRGNGWGAAAMTEVLLAIPDDDPNRLLLLTKYQNMMAGLVACQSPSGMWYQVLNMGSDPRDWEETSCTGLFVFALATGVREGWLPEVPYKKAALDGWAALSNYVDSQGRALQVCSWMTQSSTVRYYLDRERDYTGNDHGQLAVIFATTAMKRLEQSELAGDIDGDGDVDFDDLKILADNWLEDYPSADIFPPGGDGIINFLDFAALAQDWM